MAEKAGFPTFQDVKMALIENIPNLLGDYQFSTASDHMLCWRKDNSVMDNSIVASFNKAFEKVNLKADNRYFANSMEEGK